MLQKQAYELGIQLALHEAGFTKEAARGLLANLGMSMAEHGKQIGAKPVRSAAKAAVKGAPTAAKKAIPKEVPAGYQRHSKPGGFEPWHGKPGAGR